MPSWVTQGECDFNPAVHQIVRKIRDSISWINIKKIEVKYKLR